MNRKNLRSLIETLKEYDNQVALKDYQTLNDDTYSIACSLEELHPCGNKACVAGMLGLMPEFTAMGGFISIGGCPKIRVGGRELTGLNAVSYFLGLADTPDIELFLDPIIYNDGHIQHWYKWRGLEAAKALEIMERYFDRASIDEDYVHDYIEDLNEIEVRDS